MFTIVDPVESKLHVRVSIIFEIIITDLPTAVDKIVIGPLLPRLVGIQGSVTSALEVLHYFELERSPPPEYNSRFIL